jgi:hypothetical protein
MVRSTFFQRFGPDTLCGVPANLLSQEPIHNEDTTTLQADARRDGKCSFRMILALGDGTNLAHVAALPDFKRAPRFTVMFSESQLALAQPLRGYVQAVSS